MGSRLVISLLGPPQIERDGVPLTLDRRKAVALLAYLAVTGESHRRDSLVNLFWPEYDTTRGRASLRQILYVLNKALVGDWMGADRQTVNLRPEADIWVDVNQFRRHLSACEGHGHPNTQVCPSCVAPLTSAVSLYRGDFLTGFGLKDSFAFDEWQLRQADLLRSELAGALERLERWHMHQRDYASALGFARRRLVLDPLDEQTHYRLMLLYAWSGQRTSALRQYETCVQALDDELGVPPQNSLTELYEALEQGRSPPPPESQTRPPSKDYIGTLAVPPRSGERLLHPQFPRFLQVGEPVEKAVFVAREPELAQLQGYLGDALDGQAKVAFVTGEAGSGKTTLLQEFAARAQEEDEDLVVAWGRCNAHTGHGDPYLPFREILELLTGDVEACVAAGAMTVEEARRLWHLIPLVVPVLLEFGRDLIGAFVPASGIIKRASAFATQGSDWVDELVDHVDRRVETRERRRLQQSALFEQYTRVVRALSEQDPLLMILDDLQWADHGSASLLFHLGRRMKGSRILIVGAYRPAEITTGRFDAVHHREPISTTPSPYPQEDGLGFRSERERHPLAPVIHEFKRCFGDVEVDLERAHSRRFVNAFLDSEPNRLGDAFRETIHQHTQGYPLFTVELLRGMQDRGDLLQDEQGRWVESGELNWDLLPARVEAVIAQRISRLPRRLQEILEVASVEGETFTAEVIARVDVAGQREIVHCLSRRLDREHRLVKASGVLRESSQRVSQYRFRHILFQKYLYGRLDVVQRAQLHSAVGHALEELHAAQPEQVSIQLARHFEEAGILEKAIEYLRQAGDQARRVYANQEAQRYYARALALLRTLTPDGSCTDQQQRTAVQLHENLGDVLMLGSQTADASTAFRKALESVQSDDRVWKARLQCKMGNLWRAQGSYAKALEAYDRAESTLGAKPPDDAQSWWQEWFSIQIHRIWCYYWLARWPDIAELVQKAKPAVEQYGSPSHRMEFLGALCTIQFRRDRYLISDETVATLKESLALSLELGDIIAISSSQFDLGFAYLWRRDLDRAEAELQAALEGTERSGDVVRQTRCLTYLTILYRMREDIQRAQDHADRSLEQATMADMVEYVGSAQANLAWIAWRQASMTEAEQKARLALELWEQTSLVYPFCWLALWPLIAVSLDKDQLAEAMDLAQVLLQETQMRLPDDVEASLNGAIRAWEADRPERAKAYLSRALEASRQRGYL